MARENSFKSMITCKLKFQADITKTDVGYIWGISKKERWKGVSLIERGVYDRLWHICHRKLLTCPHDLLPHAVPFIIKAWAFGSKKWQNQQ